MKRTRIPHQINICGPDGSGAAPFFTVDWRKVAQSNYFLFCSSHEGADDVTKTNLNVVITAFIQCVYATLPPVCKQALFTYIYIYFFSFSSVVENFDKTL